MLPLDLDPLDTDSPAPPFEQLRTQLASRAASGALPAGTRLPAVRALAEQLGLAAGTVARAYKELEADGVVVTEGRRGTSVAAGAGATGEAAEAAREAAGVYATTSRRLGARARGGAAAARARLDLVSRAVPGPVEDGRRLSARTGRVVP